MRRKHGWVGIALALVIGGCGSSSDDEPPKRVSAAPATTTTPATPTATPTPTPTSTTPRSTSGNGKRTATTTRPTPTTTAPQSTTTRAPATKSTPAKLGKPQTFSGDGDSVIGTLVLKRNAVVRWTLTGGGAFRVRDAGDRLKISGRGTSGQTFAEAGDYRSVKVTASGRWTLSFATLGA